jgi:hypothetical protein
VIRAKWTHTALRFAVAVVVALPFFTLGVANSRQNIRDAFFSAYPGAVGTRLDNVPSHAAHCGACHFSFDGGGPRNPYGRKVEAALPGFPNNPNGKKQAVLSVGGLDPDGDGYTSTTEITDVSTYVNTPTFPGLAAAHIDSVSNVDPADLSAYLTPTTTLDLQPPVVAVVAPNGSESWTGGTAQTVQWTATDDVGVTGVDVFYKDGATQPWKMIARNLANTGAFIWFVHNTPAGDASVRVLARDAVGHMGADSSNAGFTILATPGGIVPTTLRDFEQPGTQPFGTSAFSDHTACMTCHGGYDTAAEPGHAFKGMMMAQAMRDPLFEACLAIAEQDAPSSGDLCLRCHTPFGWLAGRSQPTSGSQLTAFDRDGVSCDFCHRAVDPVYKPGVSPPEDQNVLAGMMPAHIPTGYSNGQYVVDSDTRRRGPFDDAVAPHPFLESSFHRSSDFCGTCHDVSNPVFTRVSGADYAPGPLDQKADSISSLTLFPLERTYSEWKNSSYPAGVFAPEFAGNKPDGIVASCQDCHMPDVSGKGCNDVSAPVRANLPFHDFTGGNAWLPALIATLFPGETDAAALADGAARAVSMLQRAATLDLEVLTVADSFEAVVTVTNRTGHKLPTGYPEGRRMWIQIQAEDDLQGIVYTSGAYDAATGVLTHDADAMIYEVKLGVSPALGGAIGIAHGETFHFALNDSVYKDNRIPPLGYTQTAFDTFGGTPTDPTRPAPRYPDGQNWDTATFPLPPSARKVRAMLYYQTTSKEYVEFLRDENVTTTAGDDMYALWNTNGKAAPVAMAGDSASFTPVGIPLSQPGGRISMRPRSNPFQGELVLDLSLPSRADVRVEIFDAQGRRVATRAFGSLPAGAHALRWDGAGAARNGQATGVVWARVHVGERVLGRQVVKLR